MNELKKNNKVLVAIAHGILLFTGLWLISNSTYSSRLDEGILKQVNMLQSKLFSNKPKYDHDFVFINVSRDLKLVSDPEEYGEVAITDRDKLARFFKILADNGNQHYFALCDIFFEFPDAADTTLLTQLKRAEKLVFPFHLSGDSIERQCLPAPAALSDFVTYTGNFSKFKMLYQDSLKTIPLVLLETLDKKKYPSTFLDFRSVFPRYYIIPSQLTDTKKYPYFNLGELLMLSETDSFYNNFLKDRFIVIGNFDTDVHLTPVGSMPGPLILLNSYLTIRNGRHVSWWWALFMVAGLSYISYILFFGKVKPPDVGKRPWLDLLMQVFINKYFSFGGICLLLVILSSFVFSVQPNISLLLLYLLVFNFFKEFYKKHYKQEKI